MMNLDRILERLNIAAAAGIELTPDQRKARDLLGLLLRVDDDLGTLDAPIAEAQARAQSARAARESSATTTFPGVRRAPDDLVVLGSRNPVFRLLEHPDGKLSHDEHGVAIVRNGGSYRRSLADGEELDGYRALVFEFSPHRTVSYIGADIWAALPRRLQDRIDARQSAPNDLWRDWSGGAEAFLPLNRGRSLDGYEGQPSEEELTAATAKAIEKCRDLVAGCVDVALLRTWRDNAGTAGEASGPLRSLLEKRLGELGADDMEAA